METSNRIAGSRARWIAVLLLLHAAVQTWTILRQTAPESDGARYLTQAARLEREPWLEVFRSSEDHPGYPVALWALYGPLRALGWDSPAARVYAAEALNSALGALLAILVFLLGESALGRRTAGAGAMAFVLLPRPAWHLSGLLSDPLHALLWALGAGLAARGLSRGNRTLALLGGVSAGLAYWVRVDAASLPAGLVLGLGILALARHRPASSTRVLAGAGLFLGAFAGLWAAFAFARGSWSGKPVTESLWGLVPGTVTPHDPVFAGAGPERLLEGAEAAWGVASDLAQTLQYLPLGAAVLALFIISRTRPFRTGERLLLAFASVHLVLVILVRATAGYTATRYFLPLAPFITVLAAHGVVLAAERVRSRRTRPGTSGRPLARGILVLAALAQLSVSLPSLASRRKQDGSYGVMLAGEWIRDRLRPGDTVHDPYFFPSYLAGLEDRRAGARPTPGPGSQYWIVDRTELDRSPEAVQAMAEWGAECVVEFPLTRKSLPGDARVYRAPRTLPEGKGK